MNGLLSKDYAKARAALINPDHNDPAIGPGDPYPYEGRTNPFGDLLRQRAAMILSGGVPGRGAPSTSGSMNSGVVPLPGDVAFDETKPGVMDEGL